MWSVFAHVCVWLKKHHRLHDSILIELNFAEAIQKFQPLWMSAKGPLHSSIHRFGKRFEGV